MSNSAPTFAIGDGKVTTAIGSGTNNDVGQSVVVQADGKIVVAGYSGTSNSDFAVVRYNTDGSLDTAFGTGGKVTTDFMDTSFGANGGVSTAIGPGQDIGYSVVLQADGKIVVAGTSRAQQFSDQNFALVRYNADGSLDLSFDGVNTLNATPTFVEGHAAVVLDSDAAIYDAQLEGANSYAGATLSLARSGGADAHDVFGGSGTLSLAGGSVVVASVTVGTFTQSGGTLTITFNANATNARTDEVLRQLTYSNSDDAPPASVQIAWTFSDGNSGAQGTGGALSANGSITVAITAVNDAPVITLQGDLDALVANSNSDNVSVLHRRRRGRLHRRRRRSAPATAPVSVALGDVDGDGDLDALVANVRQQHCQRADSATALGGFTAAAPVGVGNFPISVALGDVNGDGDLDALVANTNSDNVSVLHRRRRGRLHRRHAGRRRRRPHFRRARRRGRRRRPRRPGREPVQQQCQRAASATARAASPPPRRSASASVPVPSRSATWTATATSTPWSRTSAATMSAC